MKVDAGNKMETLNLHPLVHCFRHDVVILCAELCLCRAVDVPTELLQTLLMTSLVALPEA